MKIILLCDPADLPDDLELVIYKPVGRDVAVACNRARHGEFRHVIKVDDDDKGGVPPVPQPLPNSMAVPRSQPTANFDVISGGKDD